MPCYALKVYNYILSTYKNATLFICLYFFRKILDIIFNALGYFDYQLYLRNSFKMSF